MEDYFDAEFWAEREAVMARFKAAKERKKQRMAQLEDMLRKDYVNKFGVEPKYVNAW